MKPLILSEICTRKLLGINANIPFLMFNVLLPLWAFLDKSQFSKFPYWRESGPTIREGIGFMIA